MCLTISYVSWAETRTTIHRAPSDRYEMTGFYKFGIARLEEIKDTISEKERPNIVADFFIPSQNGINMDWGLTIIDKQTGLKGDFGYSVNFFFTDLKYQGQDHITHTSVSNALFMHMNLYALSNLEDVCQNLLILSKGL